MPELSSDHAGSGLPLEPGNPSITRMTQIETMTDSSRQVLSMEVLASRDSSVRDRENQLFS